METSSLTVGFASKLAPTGQFFGVEHVLVSPRLTPVNGYSASAFHCLDYLLTWNCSHIANAQLLPRVRAVLQDLGYTLPTVCTPEEMLDDEQIID